MKPLPPDPIGLVEQLSPFRVRGWVVDRRNPLVALDLVVRVDGVALKWFRPHFPMPMVAAYIGWSEVATGLIGFDVPLPDICSDGHQRQVEILVAATGKVLQSDVSTVLYCNPQLPLAAVPQSWWNRDGVSAVAKARPAVTVAVLNRNGCNVLNNLLQSWITHHDHTRVAVEWVVIDHASNDGSLAMLRSWQTRMDLRVKALKVNDSFSASCNLAARMSRAPYLLFLNNDIIWLHDALPEMVRSLNDDPQIGLVGLKLIKSTSAEPSVGASFAEVQHLGVRFRQHEQGYWPYEAAPSSSVRESEYLPQQVPAVTGAAMLCRKADFDAVGGFDEAYFYGFEDVELCMRLTQCLGKRAVCRNDLVALHRHGYTRLTGREDTVTRRLQQNAHVLNRHMGLWIKRAWWRSLITADRNLTAEPLAIGLLVDRLPGATEDPSPSLQAMLRLGDALRIAHPNARVVLLHPGLDAHEARGLHVLVASEPTYDIRRLRNARPDLRCIAWLSSKPAEWSRQPWWLDFDGYVAPDGLTSAVWSRSKSQAFVGTHIEWDTSTTQHPLGRCLDPQRLPLRVTIHVPVQQARATLLRKSRAATLLRAAEALHVNLKSEGVACWQHWDEGIEDMGAPDSSSRVSRVVDARIHVLHSQCPPSKPWQLDPGCLNIAWHLSPAGGKVPVFADFGSSEQTTAPDLTLGAHSPPRAADIARALESRIGRAFPAP